MKKDTDIVHILKTYKVCWLCDGLSVVKDLDNNPMWTSDKPKKYIECPDCRGRGYYKNKNG